MCCFIIFWNNFNVFELYKKNQIFLWYSLSAKSRGATLFLKFDQSYLFMQSMSTTSGFLSVLNKKIKYFLKINQLCKTKTNWGRTTFKQSLKKSPCMGDYIGGSTVGPALCSEKLVDWYYWWIELPLQNKGFIVSEVGNIGIVNVSHQSC